MKKNSLFLSPFLLWCVSLVSCQKSVESVSNYPQNTSGTERSLSAGNEDRINSGMPTDQKGVPDKLPGSFKKGLLAWYPFNGNAVDYSGNGYDGINNGAVSTNDRFGNSNSAFYFNNSSIISPISNIFLQSDFSISLWVELDQNANSEYPTFMEGDNGYLDFQFDNFNPLQVTFYESSGIGTGITYGAVSSVAQFGVWMHLAVVNSKNKNSLYLNGALIATSSAQIPSQGQAIGNFLSIGNGIQLPQEAFIGKVDDVRIYKRALRSSEIYYLATH
ncbi:MAG TPA: LamG domain-containing protein [Chitinophagaceae bacterium]|nr:LamG domain-containing protein [Chitinophagaceae bacterium]